MCRLALPPLPQLLCLVLAHGLLGQLELAELLVLGLGHGDLALARLLQLRDLGLHLGQHLGHALVQPLHLLLV